jgi:putative ABC transport system permease protein
MSDEPRWRRYLRLWGADPGADIDDELRFHLEERTRLNISRGMDEAQARAAAASRFGDLARIRSECAMEREPMIRGTQRGETLADLGADMRIAARSLRRAPLFTGAAVLVLALGVGAGSAVFTVMNTVLLRPLPYAAPEQLVRVYVSWQGAEQGALSPAEYLDFGARVRAFDELGVYAISSASVMSGDQAERVSSALATPSTFATLGVAPMLGRLYAGAADPDEGPVALLSYEYWQTRFGGDAGIVGSDVVINGTTRTITGVLPPGVRLPSTYREAQPPALFVPLNIDVASNPPRGSHFLRGVARLAPGWTMETATADVSRVAAELVAEHPADYPAAMNFGGYVRPLHDDVVSGTRRVLFMLAGAVALLLLIACVNVSSLVLTRMEDRRHELAVRSALGAGRWRIARQLAVEHLLLAGLAAALGAGIAVLGVRGLSLLQPGDIPRLGEARVDAVALAFTMAIAILATLLAGLAAVRRAPRPADLREAGARMTLSRSSHRLRRTLIAAEVALTIVLLAGGSLLLRSFANLLAVEPGYRMTQLLTVPVSLPGASYTDDVQRRQFFARLVEEAGALPGVVSAGAVANLPLASGVGDLNIELEGRAPAPGDASPRLDWQVVTPGWHDAMGIDIVRGRGIQASDDQAAPGAVVLSESAARRHWGTADPIGQRFRLGAGAGPGWVTVVGVARDVRHGGLTAEPEAIMYLPHAQFSFWNGGPAVTMMTLVLHTAGEPMSLMPALREITRRIDPAVPLGTAQTMEQVRNRAVAEPRFAAGVLGAFAALALLLALVGIYGLVAYTVSRRTREIAVRMAMGAQAGTVVREVTLQGLAPVLAGAVVGTGAALLLSRLVQHMLHGVGSTDPLSYAAALLLLLGAALAACVLPARRASQVAPLEVLR